MRVLAPALLVPALCRLALAQPFLPPAAPPAPPPSEEARGRALYDQLCKLCHGAEAVGYAADRAPQLRNPTFLATASNTFLRQAIERGRPGTPMSAFGAAYGGPLQADGVQALITYLRSLAFVDVDKQVVGGNAAAGRGLYRQHCQGCHGESGQGLSSQSKGDTSKGGPALSNPVFLATASDGFLRYAIEHGRPGTPMPAFQGRLSAGQIQDLTRHLRSFARPAAHEGAVGPLLPLPDPARVVQNPKGKPPRFSPLREGRYVPAAEVAEALKRGARLVLLDARATSDWHKGHIPGAYPTPFYDGQDALARALPRDGTWILTYCACPHAASGQVMDKLRAAGFKNTAVIDEGVLEWARRGYPMTGGPAAK